MPHRIEVDDDVYGLLERNVRGFEQPNDVLRRLLFDETTSTTPVFHVPHVSSSTGKLYKLVVAGLIKPDDKLVHEQTRKGNVFTAKVSDTGWVVTDLGFHRAPSPALAELVGSQIDGWANGSTSRRGRRCVRSDSSCRTRRRRDRASKAIVSAKDGPGQRWCARGRSCMSPLQSSRH